MSASDTPLRVTALAVSAQLGGTERVLLDFANRAFEHGVSLRVLTPVDGPLIAILNKIGIPAEVLPAAPAMVAGSQQPGHLRSIPLAMLGIARWARRVARHPWVREADVVYTVSFKTHIAGALARVHPLVWHLHEYPPPNTARLWRLLAAHLPDALIANSDAAGRAWFGDATARPSDRLTVVRNGVNLDRFRPRERTGWIHRQLGIPASDRLVGMPAVFARWKGQVEVMQAFDRIQAEFPDVHLVIVGGTIYDTVAEHRYGEELQRITGEWKIADLGGGKSEEAEGPPPPHSHSPSPDSRVHMLPFQQEVELAFVEFDVAVHYSLRPEPFGRVVLESMACGVPVIAANEGGPIEVLGGTDPKRSGGWLAPPRDPDALAAVLGQALSLPRAALAAIGAAGRVRAEDHFSSRAFSGKLAETLRRAVGR